MLLQTDRVNVPLLINFEDVSVPKPLTDIVNHTVSSLMQTSVF